MLPNFSTVVQKDDKTYLKDEATISRRLYQVSELQGVLDDAVKFLHDGDFPAKAEDVFNVLDHGRDGLLTVVWNRADQEAKRLNCRPYVAETWREQERDSVTPEQWKQADAIRLRYQQNIDGLPFDRLTDITDEDGLLLVDTVAISRRIEDSCTIEITPEMKNHINNILDMAGKIVALELQGVNALELVAKAVRETERPEDAELFRRIVFRRHPAGTIHKPDIDMIMNMVALNNTSNNPLNQ